MIQLGFHLYEAICCFVMMLMSLLGYLELRYAMRLPNRKAMFSIFILSVLELVIITQNGIVLVLGRLLISVAIFILSICIFRKLKNDAWALQSQKWYCVIFWILAVCNGWVSLQRLTLYLA